MAGASVWRCNICQQTPTDAASRNIPRSFCTVVSVFDERLNYSGLFVLISSALNRLTHAPGGYVAMFGCGRVTLQKRNSKIHQLGKSCWAQKRSDHFSAAPLAPASAAPRMARQPRDRAGGGGTPSPR